MVVNFCYQLHVRVPVSKYCETQAHMKQACLSGIDYFYTSRENFKEDSTYIHGKTLAGGQTSWGNQGLQASTYMYILPHMERLPIYSVHVHMYHGATWALVT